MARRGIILTTMWVSFLIVTLGTITLGITTLDTITLDTITLATTMVILMMAIQKRSHEETGTESSLIRMRPQKEVLGLSACDKKRRGR